MSDNAMSENGTSAARLVGCVIVSSTERGILEGMSKQKVSMFGSFLINFVIFPKKIVLGRRISSAETESI